MPIPIILDMDPGVDDALAILLAAASPELEILALTTVSGNVSLELATENALKVLELVGREDVPVLTGADAPLSRNPVRATEVHGPTGLGDARLPDAAQKADAGGVDRLVETLAARPGDVTVIATGPLTNLALAERREPGILGKASQVIVMGGTVHEPGNVSAAAEFNFFADPEAAAAVLEARDDVTVVGLDVTHRVVLESEAIQTNYGHRAVGRFVAESTRPAIDYMARAYGISGIHLHDPLALAVAIDPTLVTFTRMSALVETEGRATTGALVVDRRPFVKNGLRSGSPIQYGVEVDVERFLTMFGERVGELAEAVE